MNSENPTPSAVSRRSLLKAAGWAAPAIVLTTAAPAASASTEIVTPVTPKWTVTSYSYRGTANGWRGDVAARFYMDFVVSVEGAGIDGVEARLQLQRAADPELDASLVEQPLTGALTGSVGEWVWRLAQPGNAALQYKQFNFTSGPIAAGGNSRLQFRLEGITTHEAGEYGYITFTASGANAPAPITFRFFATNTNVGPGYVTDPGGA